MNKVAQDSYSQGVLDFFKTASVDPAIREAAVGMLTKTAASPEMQPLIDRANKRGRTFGALITQAQQPGAKPLTATQLRSLTTQLAANPELLRTSPNILPTYLSQMEQLGQIADARDTAATKYYDEASQLEKQLQETRNKYRRRRDLQRGMYADLEARNTKLDAARKQLAEELRAAQASGVDMTDELASYKRKNERLTRYLDEARQGTSDVVDELSKARGEASMNARLNEIATKQRDKAIAHGDRLDDALSAARGEAGTLRESLSASNLERRNLQRSLKNVKGHRAGLGALAALGLGYIGYDQLSGGGLGAPAPTQPLGPPRSA